MKKYIMLGIALFTVFTLCGMLSPFGVFPEPKPVSALVTIWPKVTTPSNEGEQLQPGSDVSLLAVAPDGSTMFSYDNTTHLLYKSTDAGVTWTSDSIGAGLEGDVDGSSTVDAGDNIVAIAISPDYGVNTTIVAATAKKVFRSINGGANFGEVGTNVGGLIAPASAITSIDYAKYYTGPDAILVGDADPTGATMVGGVSLFTMTTLTWTDITPWLNPTASPPDSTGGTPNVLAVAFSPLHQIDALITALTVNGTTTHLQYKMDNEVWGATVSPAQLGTGAASYNRPTRGVLEFPADYEWSVNNRLFAGMANPVTGTTDNNDVYLVTGGIGAGSSTFTRRNIQGGGVPTEVRSLAFKGTYAGGKLLAGTYYSSGLSIPVWYSGNPSATTVTWSMSTKNPTGGSTTADYTTVAWSPTGNDCYAATTGKYSAFSRSQDNGATWNQLALIDVSALANLSIVDIGAASASTLFILMFDDADASNTVTVNDYSWLFKTTDGGTNWEGVWNYRSIGDERMNIIGVSPSYTADSTVYIAQTNTRIWKSANGGTTWVGLTATGTNIRSFYAYDGTTYYFSSSGTPPGTPAEGFYKSGRWTSPSLADRVQSIAIAPDGTIFAGTNDGDVLMSTDDGQTFSCLGIAEKLGNGFNVTVAVHPAYIANKTIYAGSSDATRGVNKWKVGVSTFWTPLDDDSNTLNCSAIKLSNSVLYAASATADKGIRRSQNSLSASPVFESLTTGLTAGARFEKLQVTTGSTVLFGLVSGVSPASFGYTTMVLKHTDSQSSVVSLEITGMTTPVTAGTASNITVTVKQGGVTKTNYTGTVHFVSGDAQAVLPPDYTFTPADSGVHIFTGGVTLKTAGDQVVIASDTGDANIFGISAPVKVNPGTATSFSVTGIDDPIFIGVPMLGFIDVAARDQFGNIATGYTGTVHFTSSDPAATMPADTTIAAADKGVKTVPGITFHSFGEHWVRATDTSGLTGAQTGISVVAFEKDTYHLAQGWNLFSVPFSLLDVFRSWSELATLVPDLADINKVPIVYYYDPNPALSGSPWKQVTGAYDLYPCDAIFVKVASPAGVDIKLVADTQPTVSSKKLYAGWNLVGLGFYDTILAAPLPGSSNVPLSLKGVDQALASVYQGTGGLSGYAQVISPPGFNQTNEFVYLRDNPGAGAKPNMAGGDGYWVFMVNPGILTGFTATPLP